MLTSIVVAIVRTCTRFATLVVILSLLLAVGASYYAARHFSINTDINTLISVSYTHLTLPTIYSV